MKIKSDPYSRVLNCLQFKTDPSVVPTPTKLTNQTRSTVLIGPSGPMKWYAMKYFTLKTLNTNSQGKVAKQIFGNLPCRSPLKN